MLLGAITSTNKSLQTPAEKPDDYSIVRHFVVYSIVENNQFESSWTSNMITLQIQK